MSIDLRFYVRRFLRRSHYFLLITILAGVLGITVASVLPPVYQAEARLLVEAPQIPDDLAPTTVRNAAPEILQIIKERLTTRERLLEMSRSLDIYAGEKPLEEDQIVADMRERTTMLLPNSNDRAAFVTVSFAAKTGELSAKVTNAFVDAIVEESVALRTASAAQTLDFFTAEVARLNEELARQGAKILEFKLANKDALPDSLDYRRTRQTTLQERILQLDRDFAGLRDRRARLVELYERTGQVEQVTDARTSEQRQLQELQDELTSALAILSPQNPRVKNLQAQIEALQKVVAGQVSSNSSMDVGLTVYEVQLADIDGQAQFISDQKAEVEAELNALKASIDATPENAITLDVLERDYENIQLQYNTAVSRLSQAAVGDRIESLSKGQRITVIEAAIVPNDPARPNRKLIVAGSIGGGMALGAALLLLLEFLDKSIRRPVDVTSALGITPFATIPFIRSRQEMWRRRLLVGAAFLITLVGMPLGLYLLHTEVMPLDEVLDRLLSGSFPVAGVHGQLLG